MKEDRRFQKGIDHFNRGEFFQAHDVWEEIWHETHDESRGFVQGLIQVASALHQERTANMRGARLLYDSSMAHLTPYGDFHHGINLKKLRKDFGHAFKNILSCPFDQLPSRRHPGSPVVPLTSCLLFKI
jgi:predicted metal-dependent hydrolase